MIFEKSRALPDELQLKALHYVDGLLQGKVEEAERQSWSRFSAEQLLSQYAPADAIYDQD